MTILNRFDVLQKDGEGDESSEPGAMVLYLGCTSKPEVNAVSTPGWKKISAIVDTGAEESVAPDSVAKAQLRPSSGSRKGQTFCSADGGVLPNMGDKSLGHTSGALQAEL